MKNLLYVVSVALFLTAGVFGQDKTQTGTPSKDSPTTPSETFTREKFDPARDPKTDLKEAVEMATKSGKRIILDIGGEWCGWCVYMDTFFSKNPPLSKIRDDNFIWVKVNMSEQNENKTFLKLYPEPSGYPHLYILSKTGRLLRSQDTSYLELGKGYNIVKFTQFLRTWSPKKVHK